METATVNVEMCSIRSRDRNGSQEYDTIPTELPNPSSRGEILELHVGCPSSYEPWSLNEQHSFLIREPMDEQDDKNVSDAGAWDQSRHTLNPSEQSNAAREADQDDITMQTLQALCDQVDLDNRMNECLNDLLTPFDPSWRQ